MAKALFGGDDGKENATPGKENTAQTSVSSTSKQPTVQVKEEQSKVSEVQSKDVSGEATGENSKCGNKKGSVQEEELPEKQTRQGLCSCATISFVL